MPITATIDRFEANLAIVRLDDGQEIIIAKKELPDGVGEGARLILNFSHEVEDENRRAARARQLLSDLLQRKQ